MVEGEREERREDEERASETKDTTRRSGSDTPIRRADRKNGAESRVRATQPASPKEEIIHREKEMNLR